MKNITKRIITSFLVVLLIFTSIPCDAFAEEIIADNELENIEAVSETDLENFEELIISEENISVEENEIEEDSPEVIDEIEETAESEEDSPEVVDETEETAESEEDSPEIIDETEETVESEEDASDDIDETTDLVESEEIIDIQNADEIERCEEEPDGEGKFYFADQSYLCYFEITGATEFEKFPYMNSAIYSIDDSVDKVKIKINARINEYDGSYCDPKLYEFNTNTAVYEDYVTSIGFDTKTRTIEKIYEIDSSYISTKEFYLDDNEQYSPDTTASIVFDDNGLVESVECRVVGGPGTEKIFEPDSDPKTFDYVKGAHVEIIPTFKSTDAYRLKEVLVNDEPVKFSSKGVIEISETENSTIKYVSENVYEAYIKDSSETISPINNKYYIGSDKNYNIELYNAISPVSLELTDASAIVNKKSAPEGFITLKQNGEEPNVINIDPSCIDFGTSNTANATIKLTYKEGDIEVYNNTFDFVITKIAIPTNYTIKGVKNNTLNLEVGEKFYADVVFNKSCDLDKIYVMPVDTAKYSQAEYKSSDSLLEICAFYCDYSDYATYYSYRPGTDKFAFFYNGGPENRIQIGEPFTLNVVSKVIEKSTPNISIAKTSNYSFVFDIKDINGIPNESYTTLYHVNAKAVGELNSSFKPEIDYYYYYNDHYNTFELIVADKDSLTESDMQQYDISVRIERFESNNDLWWDPDALCNKPKDGKEPNAVSKYKTFKKQSTKPLAYENKLTLKKGKTTIYPGESTYVDFYIATAVFSKNTSVCELDLDKSYLIDAAGKKFTGIFETDLTGLKIRLIDYSICSEVTPGKAYAHIFPKVPEGITAKEAVLPLTFKKPIYKIELSGTSTIFKTPGKAANVSYKVNYLDENDKPDNGITKKVIWEIMSAAPEIEKYVSVKNGKVTIAKEFVPSKDPSKNTFEIYIGANDFEGHEDYASDHLEVTVSAQEPVIKQGIIREFESSDYDYPISWYDPGRIIALENDEIAPESIIRKCPGEGPTAKRYAARLVDENGNDIEDGVTWKSSSKAIKISENGEITDVLGFGKVTLTATIDNGKKTTYKFSFTIKAKKVAKPEVTFYDCDLSQLPINAYTVSNYGNHQFAIMVGSAYSEYLGQILAAPVPDNTNYKVSISGAKTISKYTVVSASQYILEPTNASTIIKITQGKNVTTYTVNNVGFEKNTKAKFSKNTLEAYVGSNTPVTKEIMLSGYSFKEATAEGSYEYSIQPYIDMSYALDEMLEIPYYNASSEIFGITPGYEPYTFTPGESITLNISGKNIRTAQTLKFSVFIIERFIENGTNNSTVTRETAVPLSVKFVKAKTPKLTLGKPVIDMKGGNRVTSLSAKVTNDGTCTPYLNEAGVSNAVINGKVNKFKDYFNVTANADGTLAIELKEGIDPKDIAKNDYIGFVPMTLKDAAGFYVRTDGSVSSENDPYEYKDCIHWIQITVSLKNAPK